MAKRQHEEHERHGAERQKQGLPEQGKWSESTRRALWINLPSEHEQHHGQTLATRNHEAIENWAEERQAVPATVPGSRYDNRPGVLRFDFPSYGGQTLEHISWEEWFKTFDERHLVFLFQEHMRDGRQSNWFHLESPEREHD